MERGGAKGSLQEEGIWYVDLLLRLAAPRVGLVSVDDVPVCALKGGAQLWGNRVF